MENNIEFNRGFKMGQLTFAAKLVRDGKIDIDYACDKLHILKESFLIVLESLDNPVQVVKSDTILIPIGGRPTDYSPELALELQEKYKIMTIPEMADSYNVSTRTINRWLKKAGLFKNTRKDGKKL